MDDSYAVQAPTGFGDDFLLGRVWVAREFYYLGVARSLGLKFPDALLATAGEVVE